MRDGAGLATEVHLPRAPAVRALTFLLRTPYGRHGEFDAVPEIADLLTGLGHVLVSQDVRGKFDSDGVCQPFSQELEDGVDTLDWIAGQGWSTGRVVPTGESYSGFTALTAAASRHPSVVAVLAGMTTSRIATDWLTSGGVFRLHLNIEWATMSFGGRQLPADLPWMIDDWREVDDVEHVDTADADLSALRALRRAAVSIDGDAVLAGGVNERLGAVAQVPMVLWSGFWDPLARGTIAEFRAAVAARPDQLHHLDIASTDHLHNPWRAALVREVRQRDRAQALVECYRRNLPHLRSALAEDVDGAAVDHGVSWEDQECVTFRDSQWPPASGPTTIIQFAGEVSVPSSPPFPALPDSGETFVWGSLAASYPDERATAARDDVAALPFDTDAIIGDLVIEADVEWGAGRQLVATLAVEQPDGRLLRIAEGALSSGAMRRPTPESDGPGPRVRIDLGPVCYRGAAAGRSGRARGPVQSIRCWLLLSQECYPRYLPATQAHAWLGESGGHEAERPPRDRVPEATGGPVVMRGLSLRTLVGRGPRTPLVIR